MKSSRLAPFVWLFTLALFLTSLASSRDALPERLATHFDASGVADGWSSRTGYLATTAASTLGLTLFMLALAYSIRFFPASMLNVPRAGYWRAPENHPRACALVFRHTFWLAALLTLFMRGVHQSIVISNLAHPPALDSGELGLATATLLAGIAVWTAALLWFFHQKPGSAT